MVLIAVEVLNILLRWVHIASAVLLAGGVAYARLVAIPALAALPAEEHLLAAERLAARYRPLVYMSIAGLLVSGLYNYVAHPGHTLFYHVWFGIKMLLAAHVFASAILGVKLPTGKLEDERKRARRLAGAAISGAIVILIAALLRRIF